MKEFIDNLQRYGTENPLNYGDGDCHSILDMLYYRYSECNRLDGDAIKAAFDALYQRMHGMPLRELDRVIDVVCMLCREHEKAGFAHGVKVGICLREEIER